MYTYIHFPLRILYPELGTNLKSHPFHFNITENTFLKLFYFYISKCARIFTFLNVRVLKSREQMRVRKDDLFGKFKSSYEGLNSTDILSRKLFKSIKNAASCIFSQNATIHSYNPLQFNIHFLLLSPGPCIHSSYM